MYALILNNQLRHKIKKIKEKERVKKLALN